MQELCQEGHGDCGERGGEVKVKFVECKKGNCKQCCYASGENHICTKRTAPCCSLLRADGKNGYFIRVKFARRPSKHERLLKALLKSSVILGGQFNKCLRFDKYPTITKHEQLQLVAIKQAMGKGAKV
jgi:hypothetical protein